MTQEQFAHVIGVTVSTVNRWECGHAAPSRLAKRAILALAERPPTQPGHPAGKSRRKEKRYHGS
jgi:DNA-binding transcriptional regulator YiaG